MKKKIECVNTDICVIDCTISFLITLNGTIHTFLLEFLKIILISGIPSKNLYNKTLKIKFSLGSLFKQLSNS